MNGKVKKCEKISITCTQYMCTFVFRHNNDNVHVHSLKQLCIQYASFVKCINECLNYMKMLIGQCIYNSLLTYIVLFSLLFFGILMEILILLYEIYQSHPFKHLSLFLLTHHFEPSIKSITCSLCITLLDIYYNVPVGHGS